jgi:hypothetical protein
MTNKNNISSKHHFIPQYYLKGFYNNENGFFVYSKEYGGIKFKKASQIFYEQNLHTLEYMGDKSVIIEKFYSQIEHEFSNIMELLQKEILSGKSIEVFGKSKDFHKILKIIIALQFWRSPYNQELAQKFSHHILFLYDKTPKEIKDIFYHDRRFVKFLHRKRYNINILKAIQFVLLPLITFNFSSKTENKWTFFRAGEKNIYKFTTTDNPVLLSNNSDVFNYDGIYFPLSKELVLVSTHKNEKLNTLNIIKFNEVLAQMAKKYVVSSSRDQLEEIKSNFKNL